MSVSFFSEAIAPFSARDHVATSQETYSVANPARRTQRDEPSAVKARSRGRDFFGGVVPTISIHQATARCTELRRSELDGAGWPVPSRDQSVRHVAGVTNRSSRRVSSVDCDDHAAHPSGSRSRPAVRSLREGDQAFEVVRLRRRAEHGSLRRRRRRGGTITWPRRSPSGACDGEPSELLRVCKSMSRLGFGLLPALRYGPGQTAAFVLWFSRSLDRARARSR